MLKMTATHQDQTQKLGETIGKHAEKGTILAFSGDLGSGKTTMIQGIARGIGVPETYYITSPTYTLIHEYPGRMPFYHMDLYRLPEGVDIESLGFSEIYDLKGTVAIEWSERLDLNALFSDYLEIEITFASETDRMIRLTPKGKNATRLIKNIENNPI